ncbi:MAG: hypothetical protein ACYC3O_03265 [Burkholderiales bacterium]
MNKKSSTPIYSMTDAQFHAGKPLGTAKNALDMTPNEFRKAVEDLKFQKAKPALTTDTKAMELTTAEFKAAKLKLFLNT